MTDEPSGTWVEEGDRALHVREVKLVVLDGPDAGVSRVFGKTSILVGRRGGDLELSDKKVSALHLELRLDAHGYRARDLGSSNGTFVMGLRVLDAYLHPGAVIGIGDTTVRFEPLTSSVTVPVSDATSLVGLLGASVPMRRLYRQIEKAARSELPTLVTGETGTGKELIAEALHELSGRKDGPFVVLDCASIPRTLFASELFGHEAGAFTGADQFHKGALERAHGGTLFLDELGEVPLELQAQLLRALDAKSFRRLGSSDTIASDFRIVAATNRDLREEINRKTFRDDLYFRVAGVTLEAPPLRDRADDIELLAGHFKKELGAGPLPEGFLAWARAYAWPGNVRELKNAVERALYLGLVPDRPEPRDIPIEVDLSIPFRDAKQQVVESFERSYLAALLRAHDWNIAAAAREAKIDRMSIYKLLTRLGLERPE
ncbi:MAG: sigma 54-interacting transcriptional regulator [Sandaracinaceae bacterium]